MDSHPMKICYKWHEDIEDVVKVGLTYAWQFVSTPYVWGGKELKRDRGFDCSGFTQEYLEALGIIKSGVTNDLNSQQQYARLSGFCSLSVKVCNYGDLLFFGKSTNEITHVAIAIGSSHMLEAGGGSHNMLTTGMVRMRPIRRDYVGVLSIRELLQKQVRI
jgi:cell wall-associated NlpC family hydrolase